MVIMLKVVALQVDNTNGWKYTNTAVPYSQKVFEVLCSTSKILSLKVLSKVKN